MPNSVTEYGHAHRMFVQSIMQKGIMTGKEFTTLFKLCCKKGQIQLGALDPKDLKKVKLDFLNCVNVKLDKLGFRIKNCHDEVELDIDGNRKSYLAFVNRTDRSEDANAMTLKAMVTFQPFETDYLKVIVHAIMKSELKLVMSNAAINLFREVKSRKFDLDLADKTIDKFHEHKWLIRDGRTGKIRFHTRFLAEMEEWLKALYPDELMKCTICNKTVLKSKKCSNVNCEAIFHFYCLYEKRVPVKGTCPKCGTEIKLKPPVNEEAEPIHRPASSGSGSRGPKSGAKRKRILENDSETEEEDTYSEESEED